jgi:hypothetical protein
MISALLSFFLILQFSIFGWDNSHNIYAFPDGYVGWVSVTYEAPGAPHYKLVGRAKNIRMDFDDHGIYQTCDSSVTFSAKNQFSYVTHTKSGKEKLVPVPENYIDKVNFPELLYKHRGMAFTDLFFVGPPDLRVKYAWHGPRQGPSLPLGKTWEAATGRIAN